jgi:hypothetical protein
MSTLGILKTQGKLEQKWSALMFKLIHDLKVIAIQN